MSLSSSDNQATSIGQVVASRIGAYESAMQALGSFIGAEGLSGQAYKNAKDYAGSTLLPLLKAAILYEESLSEAVKRLPSDYRATEYLEGKSLDSEDLEAELARLDSVGMRLERSIDRALEMARDYPDYEWHAHSMMRQLNQVIDRKNKVRRQLQALYAFNERSSGFFSGIGDLESQLSQGIAQVGSDMSNFSGSFPNGLSPVWVSAVHQKWNDRVKRMRDTSSPADFRKLEERKYEEYINQISSSFETQINAMTLAELEDKYGHLIQGEMSFRNTGYGRVLTGELTPEQYNYIISRYEYLVALGDIGKVELARQETMFANLRPEDKAELDAMTLSELTDKYIYVMLPRNSLDIPYILDSKAGRAKKDYIYYRFEELMAQELIDW
ncbi:TPA: hypothetical protein ACHU7U_000920 [Streptococcus suis]